MSLTEQENVLSKHDYEDLNIKDWKIILSYLDDRTAKHCRNHFRNYLDPEII
jgi:hypothetical protein